MEKRSTQYTITLQIVYLSPVGSVASRARSLFCSVMYVLCSICLATPCPVDSALSSILANRIDIAEAGKAGESSCGIYCVLHMCRPGVCASDYALRCRGGSVSFRSSHRCRVCPSAPPAPSIANELMPS